MKVREKIPGKAARTGAAKPAAKARVKPPGKKTAAKATVKKATAKTRTRPPGKGSIQYAVLPWRHASDGIEVLIITSRDSGRWLIPKGWPMKGLAPHEAAAREAYEEAGIDGYTPRTAFGGFGYDKRLPTGKQAVAVELYSMQVMLEHAQWPEMTQRQKQWTSPAAAAELVEEPELKALILAFAAGQSTD